MSPKKIFVHIIILFLIAIFVIIGLNRQAVFQRGNPLPYLTAASKIDNERPFYPVKNSASDTYISHLRSSDEEFIEFAENKLDSRFISQEGSAYVFSSGDKTIMSPRKYTLANTNCGIFPKFKHKKAYQNGTLIFLII